jgi:hypothetical protein
VYLEVLRRMCDENEVKSKVIESQGRRRIG